MNTRLDSLDFLRGCAVAGMVIYHFLFDLSFFDFISHNLSFWPISLLGATVRLLFISIVGISLYFSRQKYENSRFIKRTLVKSLVLWLLAFSITTASWLFFPDYYIRFGILHVLATSVLIAIPFTSMPKMSFLVGSIISAVGFGLFPLQTTFPHVWWLGFVDQPIHDLDYFPLIPWLGIVLVGIGVASIWMDHIEPKINTVLQHFTSQPKQWLIKAGRHSLLIYLLHQPILLALLLGSRLLFNFAK